VHLGFGKRDTGTEQEVMSVWEHTGRQEDATIHNGPTVSDLLAARVQDRVGNGAERLGAPGFQLLVEYSRGSGDLGRADVASTGFPRASKLILLDPCVT